MSMQPPAPPPGSGDQPGWDRGQSPYGQPQPPPPPYGGYGAPPPPGYQAYGQGGYGGGYGRMDHPQGTTILVLGILSLVVCQILGPFAWSMGSKALKEIDVDPARYSNRGNVVAGKICGMVSTILLILSLAFVALIIVVAVANSGNN